MKTKSWHLNRRTVLKGAGATLALPLLDCMIWPDSASAATIENSKKRFCTIYFPFGAPKVPEDHKYAEWNWLPKEENGTYRFRKIHEPLNDLKDRVTMLQGLSHNNNMGGHASADGFLTGTPIINGKGKNTISVDQVLADKYGQETRFSSMVLSIDGGIGAPSRANTLSFNRDGLPIPALSNLKQIFNRMFSVSSQQQMLAELKKKKSILDDVLEATKDVKRKFGKQDQAKLEEYLASVRSLEKRIHREEAWIGKPLPEIDTSGLKLEATLEDPSDYLSSMFDLIYLAFQTDMTRYSTFQIGNQDNIGLTHAFTKKLGMANGHHAMAHGMNKDQGPVNYGTYLQHLTKEYARFLTRLKDTPEGSGSMLDHTLTLYGCSNGYPTHSCIDLPLMLGGGEALGFKQGQYLKFDSQVPLTNLYTTILERLGAPQESFADSNGKMNSVLKT